METSSDSDDVIIVGEKRNEPMEFRLNSMSGRFLPLNTPWMYNPGDVGRIIEIDLTNNREELLSDTLATSVANSAASISRAERLARSCGSMAETSNENFPTHLQPSSWRSHTPETSTPVASVSSANPVAPTCRTRPSPTIPESPSSSPVPEENHLEEKECSICIDDMTGKLLGRPEFCCHSFCYSCLKEWQKIKDSCPFCREPFSRILKQRTFVLLD